MEKNEFIEQVKAELTKSGVENLDVINVERAGCTYTGMTAKIPNVPTPVINMDALYLAYSCGDFDMEKCLEKAHEILEMTPDEPVSITEITDWEKAKTHLYLRLFNENGAGCAKVSRPLADMYEVPYLQMSEDGRSNVRVTPALIELWGVEEETVFGTARENQEQMRPAKITSLEQMLGFDTGLPAYIVTTDNEICGASAATYWSTFNQLCELFGSEDFYLLPSSIHEMIAIPASLGGDIEDLKEMITSINADDVPEDERLTDSVYTWRANEEYDTAEFVKVI